MISSIILKSLMFDEILKIILGYLLPLLLAGLLSVAGKFFGFIYFEFLNLRRVLILILVFIISFYFAPYWAVWITLIGFLLLVGLSLLRFFNGPTKGNKIIFAGFYDNSDPKGRLSRSGQSRLLEVQFLEKFRALIEPNEILREKIGLEIVDFRVPALIHSWMDVEEFNGLADRYKKQGLGVIWGTVDKDGNLEFLDAKLDTKIYFGKDKAQELVTGAVKILRRSALNAEEKTEFIAHTLAAIWINSFNNMLADFGDWNNALMVTKEARRVFGKVLEHLDNHPTEGVAKILEYSKRMILPGFLIEEARGMVDAGCWEEAFELLIKTLVLNPFYPMNSSDEFCDFYIAQYSASVVMDAPLKDEFADHLLRKLEKQTTPITPPNLQLLINWLFGCGRNLKNIERTIEISFKELLEAFPNNPFIYLFWADALKIPVRIGVVKPKGKLAISMSADGEGLPVSILEQSILLLEKAYELCPGMPIISSRIAITAMVVAISYPEKGLDWKKWMKKFELHAPKAKVHMQQMTQEWKDDEEDIYDWTKVGYEDGDLFGDEVTSDAISRPLVKGD